MAIVLHTTDCPKCKILEKKLDAAYIEYSKNYDTYMMIEKGFLEAPILEFNEKPYTKIIYMTFSEAVNWLNSQTKG